MKKINNMFFPARNLPMLVITLFVISILPAFAQNKCSNYASLTITSDKSSYIAGVPFNGEVVFTNNAAEANVDFTVTATKETAKGNGQVLFSNSGSVLTKLGRNVWLLKDVLGTNTLPEQGDYVISVTMSHSGTGCSWKSSLALTGLDPAPPALPIHCKATTGKPLSGVFGVMTNIYTDQPDRAAKIGAALDELGGKLVRFNFNWADIQPQPGQQFNWVFYDAVVSYFHDKKINLLPVLETAPTWAGQPGCNPILQPICTPRDHMPEYARFAAKVVERYKPGGILAKQKGWTDSYGITHWEIWNEPNGRWSWHTQPNVDEYVNMLSLANVEIRKVDPDAIILHGGFTPETGGTDGFDTFFIGVYELGAKDCFDVLNLHPYYGDNPPTAAFKKFTPIIKNITVKYGDSKKPLWFTEFGGWNTYNDLTREKIQADWVEEAYKVFKNYASAVTFAGLIDNRDDGAETSGLLRYDFSKRPAFDSLQDLLTLKAKTNLLSSLTIIPQEYLLGQTVTGTLKVSNPTPQAIQASFSVELYKESVLFWQRQVDKISIPSGDNIFNLDDVFGFKPIIPDDNFFVGQWKLMVRRKNINFDDSVSQVFFIKSNALKLTLSIEPKEYEIDQALKGKGTLNNPTNSPVIASFNVQIYQNGLLKSERFIENAAIPPGITEFAPQDLLGIPSIPNNPDLVGNWKLKVTHIGGDSTEDTFNVIMPKPVTITVDGDKDTENVNLFQGFLAGLQDYTFTPGDAVSDLNIQFFKGGGYGPNIIQAAIDLGAKNYFILSEEYQFDPRTVGSSKPKPWAPDSEWQKHDCVEPIHKCKNYEDYVQSYVKASLKLNNQVNYWQVWNEPDAFPACFPPPCGTQQQVLETFKRAHNAIRAIDPNAKITGPAISGFNKDIIEVFLKYARDNHLRFDAITWHEFGPPFAEEGISEHVKEAKKLFAKYPNPDGVPYEIHIDEYMPPWSHLIPGWALGYLYYMDKYQVNYASKSCWEIPDQPVSDCHNGLNGLLMSNNKDTRHQYWVYKLYGDTKDHKRLVSESSSSRTVALASKNDQKKELHILAGKYSCGAGGKWCSWDPKHEWNVYQDDVKGPPIDVALNIQKYPYAAPGETVKAEIKLIPNENVPGPLLEPKSLGAKTLTVNSDGSITLPIKDFGDGDVYNIIITPQAVLQAFPPTIAQVYIQVDSAKPQGAVSPIFSFGANAWFDFANVAKDTYFREMKRFGLVRYTTDPYGGLCNLESGCTNDDGYLRLIREDKNRVAFLKEWKKRDGKILIILDRIPEYLSSCYSRYPPYICKKSMLDITGYWQPHWAAVPPKDYAAYSNMVEKVVRYYNDELGLNASYELWNEADYNLIATDDEFHEMYKAFVDGVRRVSPKIPVGTNTGHDKKITLNPLDGIFTSAQEPMSLSLIKYARKNNLPLDFIAFHSYPNNNKGGNVNAFTLEDYDHNINKIKDWLTQYQFKDTLIMDDEWNILVYNGDGEFIFHKLESSFVGSTLISMENAGLQLQSFSGIMPSFGESCNRSQWNAGLNPFTCENIIKPNFNAFKAFGEMSGSKIEFTGGNDYVKGTASRDSDKVTVVLSNFQNVRAAAQQSADYLKSQGITYLPCPPSSSCSPKEYNANITLTFFGTVVPAAQSIGWDMKKSVGFLDAALYLVELKNCNIRRNCTPRYNLTDILKTLPPFIDNPLLINTLTGQVKIDMQSALVIYNKVIQDSKKITAFVNAYDIYGKNLAPSQTVNLTITNLQPGTYMLERYLIDKEHSNSCRLNKKTELSATNTECGVNGIIDRKVKEAKDNSLAEAINIFKTYLRSKGYSESEMNTALAFVSKYLANPNDPEVLRFINSLTPQQKKDLIEAFKTAKEQGDRIYAEGINAINSMDGVKLDKVESKTITVSGTAYQTTLEMEPYSVMLVNLYSRTKINRQ